MNTAMLANIFILKEKIHGPQHEQITKKSYDFDAQDLFPKNQMGGNV